MTDPFYRRTLTRLLDEGVASTDDRIVVSADGAEGQPSVRAFRHGGIALVLEGTNPEQLDAVITAWLAELS